MAGNEDPLNDETVTYDSGNNTGTPDLRFIHYNDVYHVEQGSREPVGGFARFKTLCQHYQNDASFQNQPEAITFFSGDAFSPSLESSVTKGKHMVPALNSIGTSVACLGNHDLDFGVEQFQYLASKCQFPWLCANVLDPALGDDVPLGRCKRSVMLTSSNGIKIGVIGIVEREWLDTINSLPPNLKYCSASATCAELAPQLRAEGAEMVIVVSHQREPNDDKLATKLPSGTVDLILAGHDHYYVHSIVNGTHILRSGTDFKQLSYIEARRNKDGSRAWDFNITRRDITSRIKEDPEAAKIVKRLTDSLRSKLEEPIGYTAAALDARFTTVRLKESNFANFICDLMRLHYLADCAIMAAGTMRGDQIYPTGVLRVKDVMDCFPFEDPCVAIGLPGKNLLAALENGVCKYPALEGRFPQVSGIQFTFDPSKPEGKRCADVLVGGQPIDLEKEYKIATRHYMVQGKDGFTSLMLQEDGGPARSIVCEENGILLSTILRQYFKRLKAMDNWEHLDNVQMNKRFDVVHDDIRNVHPDKDRAVAGAKSKRGRTTANGHSGSEPLYKRHKVCRGQISGKSSPGSSAESEDDDDCLRLAPVDRSGRDRDLFIMRKYSRRWWKLARLPGHPNLRDESREEDGVPWAMGIAPRVEGRITIVGGGR